MVLQWKANYEYDLAGYNLYYASEDENYTKWDVGNITQTVVRNLEPNMTHYFAVSAYDTGGLEGPLSKEVEFYVDWFPGSVSDKGCFILTIQ